MPENYDLEQQIMHTQSIQLQRPVQISANTIQHKRYGNMLIFCENPCLFSLGPDYWCFLPTFVIFCIVSFFMIKLVLGHSQNFYFRVATILICGGTCLAYFLVATSNPGVVTQQDFADSQQQQYPMNQQNISRKKLCKKCNIRVKRTTQHCNDCGVCIKQYDHHCPWTSKCIGGGNLKRFYFFLFMVPVYLIYVFVAFATLMSQIALQNSTIHIQVNIVINVEKSLLTVFDYYVN